MRKTYKYNDVYVQEKLAELGVNYPPVDGTNAWFLVPATWFDYSNADIERKLHRGAFWPTECTEPIIGRSKIKKK